MKQFYFVYFGGMFSKDMTKTFGRSESTGGERQWMVYHRLQGTNIYVAKQVCVVKLEELDPGNVSICMNEYDLHI